MSAARSSNLMPSESEKSPSRSHSQLAGKFRAPPKTYPWHAHAAYFSDPDDNLWEIYCWVGPPRTL